MRISSGSYIGNGIDNHAIAGVGFLPDLVLIKGDFDGGQAMFKITQHGINESIQMRGDTSVQTDGIKTLNSDGFTLGTLSHVNQNAATFHFLAVKDDGNGDFKTGVFTGDGNDGHAITGLGFHPAFIHIKGNHNLTGAMKFAGQTDTSQIWPGDDRTDLIVSLDADGFTLNNGSDNGANEVNANGVTHYYFAFKAVSGAISAFQYIGNDTDNRNIITPGFQPEFVLVASINGGRKRILRFASNSVDYSQGIEDASDVNGIQSFISTGFQIGASNFVNASGVTFNALAIKNNQVMSVAPNEDSGNKNVTLKLGIDSLSIITKPRTKKIKTHNRAIILTHK